MLCKQAKAHRNSNSGLLGLHFWWWRWSWSGCGGRGRHIQMDAGISGTKTSCPLGQRQTSDEAVRAGLGGGWQATGFEVHEHGLCCGHGTDALGGRGGAVFCRLEISLHSRRRGSLSGAWVWFLLHGQDSSVGLSEQHSGTAFGVDALPTCLSHSLHMRARTYYSETAVIGWSPGRL